MDSGKTDRRITPELFVSVGTVKTHIDNAYRKVSFAASVFGAQGDAAIPRRNGSAERYYTPTAGAAGAGRGKRPRNRSTADLSPSILISPERSASSRERPS
jgi:hypothetical protein